MYSLPLFQVWHSSQMWLLVLIGWHFIKERISTVTHQLTSQVWNLQPLLFFEFHLVKEFNTYSVHRIIKQLFYHSYMFEKQVISFSNVMLLLPSCFLSMDERNKLFDTGLKQLLLSVGGRQPIFFWGPTKRRGELPLHSDVEGVPWRHPSNWPTADWNEPGYQARCPRR